ncbi:MAG: cytochrome C [Roseovarius gahaiensis]
MRIIFAALAVLPLAGCMAEQSADASTATNAARVAHGADMYEVYCTSCHGRAARGDGPLADDLSVRPADLTGLAARNGGVFPYAETMARIHGYPGQFHEMPQFGPLLEGPHVAWQDPATGAVIDTPRALLALVSYLASVQRG